MPAVGGHHQLARVLLGLGRAEPSRGTVGEERALRAQLRRSIPPGAFVVLLSALVSAEPLAHAVRLARSGHAVVVVDTLPPELRGAEASDDALRSVTGVDDARLARLVWRLRLLDREREAHRCAMAGRAGHRLAGARVARHRAAPGGPPLARPEGGEPMIRNRTWRRAMVATVLVADVVILLVAGAALTGFLPFALVALVVATWWALARPAGWGAFTLVVVQVLCATVPGGRARDPRAVGAGRGRRVGGRPHPPGAHPARVVAGAGGPAAGDRAALGRSGGRAGLGGHRGGAARCAGHDDAAGLGAVDRRDRPGPDRRNRLAGAGEHPQGART